jgi:hypothetical protein
MAIDPTKLGARINASFGIGQLQQSIDALTAKLDVVGKLGQTHPVHSPLVRKFSTAKQTPAVALTYTFFDVGGPPKGRIWDLRRLTVWGADPTTAITGNCFVFINNTPPFDSATLPANFPELIGNTTTTTIPYRDSWGRGTALLLAQERVMVGIKGLPNSTPVWVYGQAIEWLEDDMLSWGGL